MILVKSAETLRQFLSGLRATGQSIGFVPTMGALHEGHISLLDEARKLNKVRVCSIFVNPTQFNDPRDFEKYPVTLDTDISLLEQNGVDFLFLPSVGELYPDGTDNLARYDLGYLESVLEGKYRPGHFQGVCQVVHRLLTIVQPDDLLMGRKDYQQCMVVQKLLQLTGMPVRLHTCPTLRETDGLAMSSRNMRLNPQERKTAAGISRTLLNIRAAVRPGDLETIRRQAEQNLEDLGFRVDYVAIAAADNLEILHQWDGKRELVALVAAYLNEIRLIDNMLLSS